MRIAIIGGSGVEGIYDDRDLRVERIETRYGEVQVYILSVDECEVVFLPRHNKVHDLPPHKINYRANIQALAQLECEHAISTNAVGGLRATTQPGEFVIIDQFLDFTRVRDLTFYDGEGGQVRHVDMTEPYCPRLRELLAAAGEAGGLGARVHTTGNYVCCEGPRFETPAEIRMFAQLGGDVVGMTGVPEAVLAREAGLCYASICIVTNLAAGLKSSLLAHTEFMRVMDDIGADLRSLLRHAIAHLADDPTCLCRSPFVD